jgi:hypothetical protein
MSRTRQEGSTRDGSGRVEITLAPGQRERIEAAGLTVSELVRHLLDVALQGLGIPDTVPGDPRSLRPHPLTAVGASTMIARCALGDDEALRAALASVPEGWEARPTTTGRVTIVAHPVAVWRRMEG